MALQSLTPIVSIKDLGEKQNLMNVWDSLYVMASDKEPGTTTSSSLIFIFNFWH